MEKVEEKSDGYPMPSTRPKPNAPVAPATGDNREIAARLKRVRAELGLSQSELADAIGGSKRGIQDNECGKAAPASAVLRGLVRLGINANWLLTGEGPMRVKDLQPGAPLDVARLRLAIETAEEAMQAAHRMLHPDRKAELVVAVYDLYSDGLGAPAKERILRLLRLAAGEA